MTNIIPSDCQRIFSPFTFNRYPMHMHHALLYCRTCVCVCVKKFKEAKCTRVKQHAFALNFNVFG